MIYDNTKKFKVDSSGKVIGVQLFVEDVPNQEYIVTHLRLVDEYESNGKTEAICNSTDRRDFYLSWPYRRGRLVFENSALPGNNNGIHIIVNSYKSSNDYGFLAIHLGKKPIISQIVGGLGLPDNRHIGYEINFGKLKDPTVPIDPNLPNSELLKRVEKIEKFLLTTFKDFK
jgi:hypothetical protein